MDRVISENDDENSEKPLEKRKIILKQKLLSDPEPSKIQDIAKSFNYLKELVRIMGCDRHKASDETDHLQRSFDNGNEGPNQLRRITIGEKFAPTVLIQRFINVDLGSDFNESLGLVNTKREINPM